MGIDPIQNSKSCKHSHKCNSGSECLKTFNQNQNPSLLPKKDIHILNLDHYEEFNDIYNEKSKLKLYSECAKIFQIDQKEVEQTFQNNDKCSEWTTIPYKKKQKNAFYEL